MRKTAGNQSLEGLMFPSKHQGVAWRSHLLVNTDHEFGWRNPNKSWEQEFSGGFGVLGELVGESWSFEGTAETKGLDDGGLAWWVSRAWGGELHAILPVPSAFVKAVDESVLEMINEFSKRGMLVAMLWGGE